MKRVITWLHSVNVRMPGADGGVSPNIDVIGAYVVMAWLQKQSGSYKLYFE